MKLINLLELMAERKAPRKIKFMSFTMQFIENAEFGDYENLDCELVQKLSDFRIIDCLTEKVEIIEDLGGNKDE